MFDTTYKNAQMTLVCIFYEPSPRWRSVFFTQFMNPSKQHAKLLKVMTQADQCIDRDVAQKLLKKADKISKKLTAA